MIGKLRTRAGRLGAVMAFLAMLFAFTPMLEAAACSAQGCSVVCKEQLAAGGDVQDTGQCSERHCICIAGHCSHVGVWPAEPSMITFVARPSAAAIIVAEHAVSATFQTPERPPRA